MNTKIIARVNNVDILSTSDEQMVAIKPICDALGIDRKRQQDKIKEHPILSVVGGLSPLTGKDGKEYEMFCLPFKYVFGWLFTINPNNVDELARPNLIKFQEECYEALYRYFADKATFVEQKQLEIDKQLGVVEEAKGYFKNAKNVLFDAETKLQKLRKLTMDDFDFERRQLKLFN